MKTLRVSILLFFISISLNLKSQCNTNTNVCTSSIAGPFTFSTPGTPVSSCLDFFGPGYAYVILYITQSGPLELLIDGDVTTGFLDVAIFNIPLNADPCTAILDPANEISCNYASNPSGCNQIGTNFPCPSSVSSPIVNVGDRLMIIVENWSGASSNFTLELGPSPAAQSGPGNPTIIPPTFSFTDQSAPYQMTAFDNGGLWSGPGISSTGLFDPQITGSGDFDIIYKLGSGFCETIDTFKISVASTLPIEMYDLKATCEQDKVKISWQTLSETNSDYFLVEKSYNGIDYHVISEINAAGNSIDKLEYEILDHEPRSLNFYRIKEVDIFGQKTTYGPVYTECGINYYTIVPNPVRNILNIKSSSTNEVKEIFISDLQGKICYKGWGNDNISVENLKSGIYFLTINRMDKTDVLKFVKD